MYTIMSNSSEGTYYLVNGWNKHKAYWTKTADVYKNGFKTSGIAIRSLKMLLKIMPDYLSDTFTLMKFENGTPIAVPYITGV